MFLNDTLICMVPCYACILFSTHAWVKLLATWDLSHLPPSGIRIWFLISVVVLKALVGVSIPCKDTIFLIASEATKIPYVDPTIRPSCG